MSIRTITAVPALFAALLAPSIAFAAFPDVPANHANYDAIMYVQSQGIVSGYPDGTFKPERHINRAEFAKIIVGSLTLTNDERRGCFGPQTQQFETDSFDIFSDVQSGEWFEPYVCVAKSRYIIEGYPDWTFRPYNGINFVEAAKIVSISLILDHPYEDTGSTWYENYVYALQDLSAIPTSVKRFDQQITRGEMAEMIYRLGAGVTTKPSKTYDELVQNNSVV